MIKDKTKVKIEATVKRVHYINDHWASFAIEYEGSKINCSGNVNINISVNDNLYISGFYYIDDTYGPKIKISSIKTLDKGFDGKTSETLIYNYLVSSAVKYVNAEMAKEIVTKFGDDTIKFAKEYPKKFLQIKKIGEKNYKKITKSIVSNANYIEITSLLPGITIKQTETLYDKYGKETVKKLKEKPYRVIYDLERFGFKRADKLALEIGISKTDKRRIGAAITYIIQNASNFGHCFVKVENLSNMLIDAKDALLPELKGKEDMIADAIISEIQEGHLVLDDEDKLYVAELYLAETQTAKYIADLTTSKANIKISDSIIEQCILENKRKFGFELDDSQKKAIYNSLSKRITAITGGPGTGKSTIINTIKNAFSDAIGAYDREGDPRIFLLAPTGKAANRMKEVTEYPSSTIHSLINQIEMSEKHTHKKIMADNPFFIVDETSMIDLPIAYKLLKIVAEYNGSIVFIGDADQLPPIGAGNFFKDLLKNKYVVSTKLNTSHRQKGTIATVANLINDGNGTKSFISDKSFNFIPCPADKICENIIKEYKKLLCNYDIKDICCLVPRRKKAVNNVDKSYSSTDLNDKLIQIANPMKKGMEKFKDFKVGDRVMQTVNDKEREIYNGDVATVTKITDEGLTVITDDCNIISVDECEVKELVLAYAMTIHKSQGSEYKATIVALSTSDFTMLQRNLLYTAVTRAKEKLILIGDPKAINIAVKKLDASERNTKLNLRIMSEVKKCKM